MGQISRVYFLNSSIANNLLTSISYSIKMSGSESRGQEEAACMRVLGLCDHYSELLTRMETLNF